MVIWFVGKKSKVYLSSAEAIFHYNFYCGFVAASFFNPF